MATSGVSRSMVGTRGSSSGGGGGRARSGWATRVVVTTALVILLVEILWVETSCAVRDSQHQHDRKEGSKTSDHPRATSKDKLRTLETLRGKVGADQAKDAAPGQEKKKLNPVLILSEGSAKKDFAANVVENDTFEQGLLYFRGLNATPVDKDKGLELIEKAAAAGNEEALFFLAQLYEFGEEVEQNMSAMVEYYNRSAALGNPAAQNALGFVYETGKGVPVNKPLALLHYEFAALGGDGEARLALAYKYLFGHSVSKDCNKACEHYTILAQAVAEHVHNSGLGFNIEFRRLVSDEEGSQQEEEDIVQYWQYSADSGDSSAQVTIGTLFLQGAHGVPQDYAAAMHYFKKASEQGEHGGTTYLGFMHLKGYGVEQNNQTAVEYLHAASSAGHPQAQALLGYIYLRGLGGVPKDVPQAIRLLKQSAEQGHVDGLLYLGNCHFYGEGVSQDLTRAVQYYLAATEGGNVVAMFNLAQMHRLGIGVLRSCPIAVNLYKRVVERGSQGVLISEAYDLYEIGKVDGALVRYERAAQMGFEVAQSNAAWLYDHGFGPGDEALRQQRAFEYYRLAAEQKNPLAHLKMGDYYFYGRGTTVDHAKAAAFYRAASDLREPQATFNLGYMHQHGLGLTQDFYLAKRYYDLTADYNPDAYVPWALALAGLGMHFVWSHAHSAELEILGMSWDTFLLVVLSIVFFLVVIIRQHLIAVHQFHQQQQQLIAQQQQEQDAGEGPHQLVHDHQD